MKTKVIALIVLVAFALGFAVGFAISKKYSPCIELPVVNIQRDTVTVRDTIKGKVSAPVKTTIVRVDTVRLQINPVTDKKYMSDTTTRKSKPDTSTAPRIGQNGLLEIPISQHVYTGDKYRAVVSGWRATLDSIEVYQDTRIITNTVTKLQPAKRKWLALALGPSIGYNWDKQIRPGLMATLGIILISK